MPLIGAGDWNDGINRIGPDGEGESIWLGWFLHTTLLAFAPLADGRGEQARAASWRQCAVSLAHSIERYGWDGGWYVRAFFDDGTPLGTRAGAECQIASIAQSWSVISGAAEPGRAARAMAAVNDRLVRVDDGLVLLFTPPFDDASIDAGYIRGYPPGIRENGGQYTHAALSSVIAFAMLGDGDKAGELFSLLNPNPSRRHTCGRASVQSRTVRRVRRRLRGADPRRPGGAGTGTRARGHGCIEPNSMGSFGFRLRGATLIIDPCVPTAWPGFSIVFTHRSAHYDITVANPDGVSHGVSLASLLTDRRC